MKITIIYFSPTGNTGSTALRLSQTLAERGNSVTTVDITQDHEYFKHTDKTAYLEGCVPDHDMLIIGAPVYAHHLQYHMKDLLNFLPLPGGKWGTLAFPFVTYGGISSGIALEEAAAILRKRKRTVVGGLKVSGPHHMLNTMVDLSLDESLNEHEIQNLIDKTADLISDYPIAHGDRSRKLSYRSRKEYLIDTIIFNEKKWHRSRYPKIHIDERSCIHCFACRDICPVGHIIYTGKKVSFSETQECIHCGRCMALCPGKAFVAEGDLERMKAFIQKLLSRGMEKPGNALY